jgi:hypothetical protein
METLKCPAQAKQMLRAYKSLQNQRRSETILSDSDRNFSKKSLFSIKAKTELSIFAKAIMLRV